MEVEIFKRVPTARGPIIAERDAAVLQFRGRKEAEQRAVCEGDRAMRGGGGLGAKLTEVRSEPYVFQ